LQIYFYYFDSHFFHFFFFFFFSSRTRGMATTKYCPDPYDVAQEGTSVDVTVRIVSESGAAFASSKVDATLSSSVVRFAYEGEILIEGTPWGALVEEDSLWTVETKQARSGAGCVHIVTVHLEKPDVRSWPLAIRGPVKAKVEAEAGAAEAEPKADAAAAAEDASPEEPETGASADASATAEADASADASTDADASVEADGSAPAADETAEPSAPAAGDEDAGEPAVGGASNLPYAPNAPLDPHSLYLLANAADIGGLPLFTRAQQFAMYNLAAERGSPVAMYRLWQILSKGPQATGFTVAGCVLRSDPFLCEVSPPSPVRTAPSLPFSPIPPPLASVHPHPPRHHPIHSRVYSILEGAPSVLNVHTTDTPGSMAKKKLKKKNNEKKKKKTLTTKPPP
jgi:hypothetical protein